MSNDNMISFNRFFFWFVLLVPTADCCVGRFVLTLWLLQLWSPEESFCDARGAWYCPPYTYYYYTVYPSCRGTYLPCLHIQYKIIISVTCQPDLGAYVMSVYHYPKYGLYLLSTYHHPYTTLLARLLREINALSVSLSPNRNANDWKLRHGAAEFNNNNI